MLCSVLREEEQQGNPYAKETQPSWRADRKRSLATHEAETPLPSTTQSCIFGHITCQTENMI